MVVVEVPEKGSFRTTGEILLMGLPDKRGVAFVRRYDAVPQQDVDGVETDGPVVIGVKGIERILRFPSLGDQDDARTELVKRLSGLLQKSSGIPSATSSRKPSAPKSRT